MTEHFEKCNCFTALSKETYLKKIVYLESLPAEHAQLDSFDGDFT